MAGLFCNKYLKSLQATEIPKKSHDFFNYPRVILGLKRPQYKKIWKWINLVEVQHDGM